LADDKNIYDLVAKTATLIYYRSYS